MKIFRPIVLLAALTLVSANPAFAAQDVIKDASSASVSGFAQSSLLNRTLGSESAPVMIDLYESFVCDACVVFHKDTLPDIRDRFIDSGLARLTFHDAPTDPVSISVRAAMVGLCVNPADFFDVADSLLEGLAPLRRNGELDQWLETAIAVGDRPLDEVMACADTEATYDLVREQLNQANAAGLLLLPAIKINGVFLPEPTLEAIEVAIAAASQPGPSGHPAD